MLKRTVLAGLGVALLLSPLFASADTTSDLIASLRAQVRALLAQIETLQAQNGGGKAFCYNFYKDLTVGGFGYDMPELKQALSASGIDVSDLGVTFDEETAAAVVKFQARYGIRQTGYVGPITRAKLNALYGCSTTRPTTPLQTATSTPTTGSYKLSVSYVSGSKDSLVPGESIALTIKGVESDGTPGTPDEGYNVQVYLRGQNDSYNLQGVNATYNSQTGYWNARLTAPTDASKTYIVESAFYCGNSSLVCGQRVASGPTEDKGQVSASFYFWLSTAITVSAPSPVIQALSFGKDLTYGTGKYIYMIEGKNFSNVVKVREEHLADGVTVYTSFLSKSDTKIIFATGIDANQSREDNYNSHVTVVDNNGQSSTLTIRVDLRGQVVAPSAPTISSIQSKAANIGTVYVGEYPTIFGTGLSGTVTVNFGGERSVIAASDKDTATTFLVPSLAEGKYSVSVTNASGQTSNMYPVTLIRPTVVTPSAPAIVMTSPTSGTSAKRNAWLSWTWSSSGGNPSAVDIYLITPTGKLLSFAVGYKNYGSFGWTTGASMTEWNQSIPNGNYTIATCPSGTPGEIASSALCGRFSVSIYGSTPVIGVVSPAGGETFQIGGPITVSFSGPQVGDTYRINLLQQAIMTPTYVLGTVVPSIAADLSKNTSTIPSTVPAGTYTAQVIQLTNQGTTCVNACALAESQPFTITAPLAVPAISYVSPDTGVIGLISDTITIYGTNLTSGGNPSVEFYSSSGTLSATVPFVSLSSISPQSITVPVTNSALAAISDVYQIRVVTPAGRSNAVSVKLITVSDAGQ